MRDLASAIAMRIAASGIAMAAEKIRGLAMNKLGATLLLAFSWTALGACQRQSKPEGAMTTAPVSVADQKTQIGKEGGDYSFGNPGCDAFVKKYEDCVKNIVPDEEREKNRVLFEKTVEELGKAQAGALPYNLEEACSRREVEAKTLLALKSCQW